MYDNGPEVFSPNLACLDVVLFPFSPYSRFSPFSCSCFVHLSSPFPLPLSSFSRSLDFNALVGLTETFSARHMVTLLL